MRLRTKLLCGLAALATFALAAQAQVPGVNSTLNSVFTLTYDASTMKKSYSATRGLYIMATGAEDICTLYGRSGQTVKVRRVIIALRGPAAGADPVALMKRSSVQVGGTATTVTPVPWDSGSAASTAVAEFYTANATTPGTLVGMLSEHLVPVQSSTGAIADHRILLGELTSPVVLRGAAQSLSVNLSAGTTAQMQASCTFEWTEDADSL